MYRLLIFGGSLDTAGFVNCPNTLSLSFLIQILGVVTCIADLREILKTVH